MNDFLNAIRIGIIGYFFLIGVLFLFFFLTRIFVKLFSRGGRNEK